MNDDRASMDAALKTWVVPELRRRGFAGSFPHLRRERDGGVDLVMFQFSRWGGEFAVELARCSTEGFVNLAGQEVSAAKVRVADLPFPWRHRLGAEPDDDHWFDFEHAGVASAVKQLLRHMDAAEAWFAAPERRALPRRPGAGH